MRLIKLTALSLSLIFSAYLLGSCESDAEMKKTTDFSKTGIVMSGAQETPAVTTAATGSLDVYYTRETRMLTYTVRWTGLSDSVLLMHIHGLGPLGYQAGVVQNIVIANPSTGQSLYAQKTAGKYTFGKTGSLSGSLLIDGVVVKEEDLLNGMYYLNIHTSVFPGGEIRGQIRFQ